MLTIPNIISIIRIILVPVFCVVYFIPGMKEIACAVLVLSGASDLADGYIARKYNQVSDLGKVLDPIADKLFQVSTILCIVIKGYVAVWILIVLVAVELFMLVGGTIFMSLTHAVIPSKWYGKAASVLFFSAFVTAFILDFATVTPDTIYIVVSSIMAAALGLSIFSTANYAAIAIRIRKQQKETAKAD